VAPPSAQRSYVLPTIVVLVGIFGPAVNAFITATVLPSVVKEIGGLSLYAWAATAYAVASIVGSAGSSVLMRKLGTRLALIVATLVLVVGTAACGSAPTMAVVVAGRAIQGMGGGLVFGVVHAMVRELFPEPMWPGRLALISSVWGVAAIGGPFAGGLLAQMGLWRAAFWGMVPIIVAPAVVSWWLLPRRTRRRETGVVPFGRLLLICMAVLCVASVANSRTAALRAALVLGALIAIALTLRLDARATNRLFPSEMLSFGRPTGKSFAMIFLIAGSASPTSVFIPLLAQVTHHVAPATAGYFYALQSLAWSVASLFSARVPPQRLRAALVAGPLIMAAGLAGVALTIGPGPVPAIAAALTVVGAGIGVCWAHVAKIVLTSAREGEEEVSAAMIPSAQLFAVAFGSAGAGIVASATGLTHFATPEIAALTGTTLFGIAALGPLLAAAMAWTLSPPPTRSQTPGRGRAATEV
jgi:MFS family permease